MTRTVVIVAMMLLAAFLPLVCIPLATLVLASLVFREDVPAYTRAPLPAVALRALPFLRAPPLPR